MPISDTDLAQIEMSAGLTLQLAAELRRERERRSLTSANYQETACRLAEMAGKLAEARGRILELETAREIDASTDAGELETLRGKHAKVIADVDTVLFRRGGDIDGAMRRLDWEVAASKPGAEPATVKP
jgi:hypothetical protein